MPEGNGDWIYFGPDCPDAYDNCTAFASDYPFINLGAYYNTNESFYDEPDILISCFDEDANFTFDGGGPWIALGEAGLNIRFADLGPEEGTYYWTDRGSDDLERIWFSSRDAKSILEFFKQAERQGKDVRIGVSGDYATVVADFDVAGFTANFQRLSCS